MGDTASLMLLFDAVGVIQNLFPAFTAAYSLYLDVRNRGWHREKAGH